MTDITDVCVCVCVCVYFFFNLEKKLKFIKGT